MSVNKEDRRRKLTDDQRAEIIQKWDNGHGQSKRALADEYNVRRYTITNVVEPKKVAAQVKANKEKGKQ